MGGLRQAEQQPHLGGGVADHGDHQQAAGPAHRVEGGGVVHRQQAQPAMVRRQQSAR